MASLSTTKARKRTAMLGERRWSYYDFKQDKLVLPVDPDELLDQLEAILHEVTEIVRSVAKHGGKYPTKNCNKISYARRLIYQIYSHRRQIKLSKKKFGKRLHKLRNKRGEPFGARTADKIGNSPIFCYTIALPEKIISSSERSRSVKFLEQAWKHRVSEGYLIGFLLQHAAKGG